MIHDSGMNSSGSAHKAKKRDNAAKALIVKREKRRKDIEDINDLLKQ